MSPAGAIVVHLTNSTDLNSQTAPSGAADGGVSSGAGFRDGRPVSRPSLDRHQPGRIATTEEINLGRLRCFAVTAEELNFRRAAKLLHIRQPTLSAHICRLERDFDMVLFKRGGGPTRLTSGGKLLLWEVRELFAHIERLRERARLLSSGFLGTIRIGFSLSLTSGVIMEALRCSGMTRTGVRLEFTETSRRRQISMLRDRELDLALTLHPVYATDLHQETVWHERLIAAFPERHPLANRTTIQWSHLATEPFIVRDFEHDRAVFDLIQRRAENSGFTPDVRYRVVSRENLLGLVAAGFGIGIVPESATGLRVDGVRFVPLSGPGSDLAVLAVRLPLGSHPDSPAIARFVDEIRKAAVKLGRDRRLPDRLP